MRIRPTPGTYNVEVEGHTTVVVITEDGATSGFYHFGGWFPLEWEWFELSGGPALMPSGGLAVQFIGFNDDGTFDMVYPDGSGKSGTYALQK